MTPENWIAICGIVAVPFVGGITAVVKLAGALSAMEQRVGTLEKRIESQEIRLTHTEGHISDIRPALATIVEGIKWMKDRISDFDRRRGGE